MQMMKLNIQYFASGTIAETSAPSSGDVRIVWSSTKNDENNNSSVTATVQIKKARGTAWCTFSGSLTIDGTSANISKYRPESDPWNTTWKDVGSYTKTINHNADGTKAITISTTLTQVGTTMAGTYKASGTATLDVIERASKLGEIENFSLTDTITIPITKYVNTFTDNLVISYRETTIKTINAITDGYELTFTTSEQNTILGLMTSPQIALTFTLTSMNGTTEIGTTTQSSVITSLDKPILYNIVKKENGHYQVGINGLVDVEDPDVLQVYDDGGTKVDNTTMIKLERKTFSTGVLSAGAKGYYTLSMTVPTGYTSIGGQVRSNQISILGGAQFTPIFNHIGTTGAQTIYVLYYAPTAINTARNVEFILTCIKTDYYNYASQD